MTAREIRRMDVAMAELGKWENFYIVVGSAAGGLIGLQFVVITLLAERPQLSGPEGISAFATPTIIHFAAVLLLSALASVPWPSVSEASYVLGAVGISGAVYFLLVTRRLIAQTVYQQVLEDWIYNVVLPFVAYAMVLISACVIRAHERVALFGFAASTLILLFVGIHNAWDAVTYHIFRIGENRDPERRSDR